MARENSLNSIRDRQGGWNVEIMKEFRDRLFVEFVTQSQRQEDSQVRGEDYAVRQPLRMQRLDTQPIPDETRLSPRAIPQTPAHAPFKVSNAPTPSRS